MTIIESRIVSPDGQGAPGWVGIRLVGPGLQPDSRTSVIAPLAFRVEGDGQWSVDLLPNTPDSPYYVVTESPDQGLPRQRLIHVEDSGEPQWIGSVVVALPAASIADPIFRGPEGPPGRPWTGSEAEFATAVADLFGADTAARDATDGRYERLIPRTGAATGDRVALLADGTLGFAAPAAGGEAGTAPNATTSTVGLVQLAGDLGGTAEAPTVPGLAGKAGLDDLAGKADDDDRRFTGYTDVTTLTDTALTLTAAHVGDLLILSNAAPITVTAPTPTSLGLVAGQIVHMMQGLAGAVTVTAGAGAAVSNRYSSYVSSGQFATVELVALSGTGWLLRGEVA